MAKYLRPVEPRAPMSMPTPIHEAKIKIGTLADTSYGPQPLALIASLTIRPSQTDRRYPATKGMPQTFNSRAIPAQPARVGPEISIGLSLGSVASGGFDTFAAEIAGENFTPYLPADVIAEIGEIARRWGGNGMRMGCKHQRAMGWERALREELSPFRALGPVEHARMGDPDGFPEVALPHPQTAARRVRELTGNDTQGSHIWTPGTDEITGRAYIKNGRNQTGPEKEIGTWDLGHHGPILIHDTARGYRSIASYADGGILSRPCPACGYGFGTSWVYEPLPDAIADRAVALFALTPKKPRAAVEAETIEQFADRLKLSARFVTDHARSGAHSTGYRFTLTRTGKEKEITGPYTVGSALGAPTLAMLLESLESDAHTAQDCPTWKDFVSEFGDESHAARQTWQACRAIRAGLVSLIGSAEIAKLGNAVQAGINN